ncbi:penicillin acylase family protein [Acidocella sp.]|uniref:penicillin acylase family protein n=1 Tax=Acidocella sp. TaxID=50710 RepID=UPI00261CECE5|nr:penicillin acylase family protein [Acidocella sp.]
MPPCPPLTEECLDIPGLENPVEIVIDRWGIPHITASSLPDLFFAQGFNTARDRLWQIDLGRKRGLGLLAADFGPGYLEQDRAARLFLYRGDMGQEWRSYGEDAEAICTAFAAGINAYIALTEAEPARLPPEFGLMGTKPQRWRPEDVVRVRTHGWVGNAGSELARAQVMARADARTDLLRVHLEPPVTPIPAEGLDLAAIPPEVMHIHALSTAPVTFSRARLAATLAEVARWRDVTALEDGSAGLQGSNNWVVNGERSGTGRALLASDPHRLHSVPSLRYLIHLTMPGFDAIGAGEPSFPGIMMGHNGYAAFGLTLFLGPDVEDIYVYETRPGDPEHYAYQGGWEKMRVVTEQADVRGCAAQPVILKFTRHGPVIHEDLVRRRAYAVRTVFTEPGAAPYAASLISMRSRGFAPFRAAMRQWGVPAVNQVYADAEGNIGWVTAGYSPVRVGWTGLLPVPGDGRFEWQGFLDPERLPWAENPVRGVLATANEMNVSPDWPTPPEAIGYEWAGPSRARRIAEVLGTDAAHGVAEAKSLQTDVVSLIARRALAVLARLEGKDVETLAALAQLRGWDGALRAESAPAALFELWWSAHLKPGLISLAVSDKAARTVILAEADDETALDEIETPGRFLESAAARDDLLRVTLAAAWRDARERLGPDPGAWSWGRLHQARFTSALAPLLPISEAAPLTIGPLPMGGGDNTVMMAAYRPQDFQVYLGASVRIVVDVGAWDNSVCINAPGQSGDPRSTHYGDLAPLWAKGEYVPMLYSRDAILGVAERRIHLMPG